MMSGTRNLSNHDVCRTLRATWRPLFLVLALLTVAQAKPMAAPKLEEGVKNSSQIVVAQYLGYRTGPVDYFQGATANYQVKLFLKGPKTPGLLAIRYSFQDESGCVEPKGWKFSPNLMPKPGSSWILLLQPPGTYRGDFGRIPYTPENLKLVKSSL